MPPGVQYRLEWNQGLCRECPMKDRCLGTGQGHRTLVVGEHHMELQRRRREQREPGFQERMRRRNAIEGTHSELVRAHGLRRARYRGLGRVRLGTYFVAAACNIKRWLRRVAWEGAWEGWRRRRRGEGRARWPTDVAPPDSAGTIPLGGK